MKIQLLLVRRETLLVISLICSGVGLLLLFFVGFWLENNVEETDLLELKGKITNVKVKNGVQMISFVPDDFLVVSFNNISVDDGETASFVGRLQEYNGRVEFVAEAVK